MPIRRFRLIDIVKDGKKEKAYYSYEEDKVLDIKVNSKEEVIYFDTDRNEQIKGKELEKLFESNPDLKYDYEAEDIDLEEELEKAEAEKNDLEEELEKSEGGKNNLEEGQEELKKADDGKCDVNVMFEIKLTQIESEKQRIQRRYSHLFESANMCDIDYIVQGAKLDKSKRYQDQVVNQSMFNKAVEYAYHETRHGHKVEDQDYTYMGMSKFLYGHLLHTEYKIFLRNDSDTTFKEREDKFQNAKARKEEYMDSVESQADEMGLDGAERQKYINDRKKEYERKYEYLIFNNISYQGYFNRSDFEERATVDPSSDLPNPKEEFGIIEAAKLGVLVCMLGNGDPRHAFVQFLDKNALKNNEFKYNDKAINDFIKNIKISEKNMEDMVYNAYDHSVFNDMFNERSQERDVKNISYEEAIKLGKELSGDKDFKLHSDKHYADIALEYKKEEAQIDENKRVLSVAKVYNDMKFIRSKKPWYYIIAHPLKAFMEYRLKNEMRDFIKENVIPGTDFEKKVNEYLNCNVKNQKKFYEDALEATNDPKYTNLYDQKEIAHPILGEGKNDYNKATYNKQEMQKMGLVSAEDKEKEEKHEKTLLDINELDNAPIVDEADIEKNKNDKERYIVGESKKDFIKKPELDPNNHERFEVEEEQKEMNI